MTLDECQSVFTLIRTDTTHDLSQKAEKVCIAATGQNSIYTNIFKIKGSSHVSMNGTTLTHFYKSNSNLLRIRISESVQIF